MSVLPPEINNCVVRLIREVVIPVAKGMDTSSEGYAELMTYLRPYHGNFAEMISPMLRAVEVLIMHMRKEYEVCSDSLEFSKMLVRT